MIFTNVSWIGDFFLLWPVASWYYKTHKEKVHFVVTKNYYMYPIIDKFLRHQPFTQEITYVDVGSNALDSRNFDFNPSDFGITGSYLNFGFYRSVTLNDYVPQYYAERHGLGVDHDYVPTLIEFDDIPHEKVTTEVAHQKNGYWPIWKKMLPSDVTELDPYNTPFEKNVWYSVKSKERHFGCTSSPVLMDLFNLKCNIYCDPGFNPQVYYRNKFHNIIKV
jgi:hypothetical protein